MNGIRFYVLCSILFIFTANVAIAQTLSSSQSRQGSFEKAQKRVAGQSILGQTLEAIGYVVAPGVVVMPTVRGEVGYDENPDKLFGGEDSSVFLGDQNLAVGIVRGKAATVVSLKGQGVLYPELDPDSRWDGGISVDTVYGGIDNMLISAGAFYYRDEISFSPQDSVGVYGELKFHRDQLEGFIRTRIQQLRYLEDVPVSTAIAPAQRPFYRNGEFDALRSEISAGALVDLQNRFGLYGEIGGAIVDYTDQRIENQIDRDGDDLFAITGLRIAFSPALVADIGVRWNRRDTEDATIGSYSSEGFDGRLGWTPHPWLSVVAEVDRKIAEPSAAFSVLSDVLTYSLNANVPIGLMLDLSFGANHIRTNEIGDSSKFLETNGFGQIIKHLGRGRSVYASLLFQRYEEDASDQKYTRWKGGIGYTIRFGAEDEEFLAARRQFLGARYGHQALQLDVGYARMHLPDFKMLTYVEPAAGPGLEDVAVGKQTNHDGQVDGIRISVAVNNFASYERENGPHLNFNAKGFYERLQDKQVTRCNFTLTTDCYYININDFDPNNLNNTDEFGTWETWTRRDVDHWGVAVEAGLGRTIVQGSLKDEVVVTKPSPWRFGLAMRGLREDIELFAFDTSVPDPIVYDEDLDTRYYGAYVGLQRTVDLGRGFRLDLSAEIGAYGAHTEYEGNYLGFIPVGVGVFVTETGYLELEKTTGAIIGDVSLALHKDMSWGNLVLTAEAGYYSYVPVVRHNDNDVDAGGVAPFGVIGQNVGTSLDSDDMFHYSLGARLTIPFVK